MVSKTDFQHNNEQEVDLLTLVDIAISGIASIDSIKELADFILEGIIEYYQYDSGCFVLFEEGEKESKVLCSKNTCYKQTELLVKKARKNKHVTKILKSGYPGYVRDANKKSSMFLSGNTVIIPVISALNIIGFIIMGRNKHIGSFSREKTVLMLIGKETGNLVARLKSENELRKSREKYLRIFNNINDVYFETYLDGTIREVSPSIEKIAGYKREEVIGKSILDYYYNPEERKTVLDKIKQDKSLHDYEICLFSKNKVKTDVSVNMELIKEDNQLKIVGTLRDISERKKAEKEVVDSERRYRALIDGNRDGYVLFNPKGHIVGYNNIFKEMLGYTDDEMKMMSRKDVTPFKWHNVEDLIIRRQVLTKGYSGIYEIEYIRKNGNIFPVEMIMYSTPEGNFWASVRDISERKKIEKNILLEKEKVILEKDKMDAILQSIGDAVLVLDHNYRIVMFNHAAAVLTETEAHKAIGKKYKEVIDFAIPFNADGGFVKKAMEKGQLKSAPLFSRMITDKGVDIPVSGNAAPLKNKHGEIIGCIIVFRDATREWEIDQAKTEFVSLASHQLRTPLTIIKGYTEMLLQGHAGEISDEQREFLERVFHGNQRMVDLVNALLDISKIDLGTFAIDPQLIDIGKIADDAIDELKTRIDDKNLNVELRTGDSLEMEMDIKLMRIIVQNLINNSVKYTQKNGQIYVDIRKQRENLLITVSDNGCGIPGAQQSKIFTKLFRADNALKNETDGTGLGLYIVKSIVDQIGGDIWFDSRENQGTVFYVIIPLKKVLKRTGNKGLKYKGSV